MHLHKTHILYFKCILLSCRSDNPLSHCLLFLNLKFQSFQTSLICANIPETPRETLGGKPYRYIFTQVHIFLNKENRACANIPYNRHLAIIPIDWVKIGIQSGYFIPKV